MKVWLVEGDDRDYDWGSQWVVGVYETEEKAKAGKEADLAEYLKGYGRRIQDIEYEITEVEVL